MGEPHAGINERLFSRPIPELRIQGNPLESGRAVRYDGELTAGTATTTI
jgi:hypothetical protein